MKKGLCLSWLLSGLTALALAQPAETVTVLQGFDPVELTQGREIKGEPTRAVTRGTYRYVFATDANLRKFKQAPERFQIQFGGGCGQMGSLSGVGNPDRFYVFAERIYIFASDQCRNSFKAAPEKHLEKPDAPPTGTAAERKQAQALIARALTAMGGAKAVDGVRNYQAQIKLSYQQKDKTLEYPQTLTLTLPGGYRNEYNWGSGPSGDLLTPQGAQSFNSKGAALSREEPVRAALERALYREPLALLQARQQRGFVAFAGVKGNLAHPEFGQIEIEWLHLGYQGATTALALDAQGRIIQIAYRDRQGAFGDVVKTFADFHSVGGVSLPFTVSETFNGKPVTNPQVQYQSITVNGQQVTNPTAAKTAQAALPDALPKFDLEEYQFGFLRRGAQAATLETDKEQLQKLQAGHMANIQAMARTGKLLAAGPMGDNGDLRGIFIFKATAAEAKALAAVDPMIQAGRLQMDLHSWFGPKGIGVALNEAFRKDPNVKMTMTKFYLAILRKPDNTVAVDKAALQKIESEHLWSVRRQLDNKSYVSAGPFNAAGALRGLFVIAAETPAAAQAIVDADPAVKAGLLAVEMHPWYVAKEVWP